MERSSITCRATARMSRRDFVCLCALAPLLFHSTARGAVPVAAAGETAFPETVRILKEAYRIEMIAHRHYRGFTAKAIAEEYPNIAYLFRSFAVSEKIHAQNYARILSTMQEKPLKVPAGIHVEDTRSNLKTAAENELEKIEKTYPRLIRELEPESFDEAIVNCMYSWKSHRQHEKKVREVLRYSGMFFGKLASEIEGMHLDFHVCEICGSTIDEAPAEPCEICNRSMSHYRRVVPPSSQR